MSTERLKKLIHYVCRECGNDPTRLGKVRLHKILFLSDLWKFKLKTESISGTVYKKNQFGPFNKDVDQLLYELQKEGKVSIIPQREDEYDPVGLIGKGQPDISEFTDRELAIVKDNIEYVCNHTANEISEKTHGPVWTMAEHGEDLPYEAYIVQILTNTTEEDIKFAASI